MASIRTKIGRALVWKFMNMNPDTGKKNMKQVCEMISNNKLQTKKGYTVTRETTPDGIRFVRVKPNEGISDKLVLYYHGGGYAAGLSKDYYMKNADYCKAAGEGVQAILLDYDLSPEYKYPVQHNQGMAMWKYVTEVEGFKPENIIMGGDSAGGNLVLSCLLQVRDEGGKLPRSLFLISPWTDMVGIGQSYVDNYNIDPLFGDKKKQLTDELKEKLIESDMYAWCRGVDRKNPYVSPVLGDYEGFPPTLFTVGGAEILLDDTRIIAKNMEEHGIKTKVISHELMFHIYPLYTGIFPESTEAFKEILKYISEQMN